MNEYTIKSPIFLFVHGTFAPEAEWTQSGSLIHKAIQSEFGQNCRIYQFTWDGHNSFTSREQSATQLKNRIEQLSTNSEIPIILVSHSHGGNIALNAVSSLPRGNSVRAIVTLGTPFLSAKKFESNLPIVWAGSISFWLFVLGSLIFGYSFSNHVAILTSICIAILFYLKLRPASSSANKIPWLTQFGRGVDEIPVLCIRHGLDEASFWLSILSVPRLLEIWLANLSSKMWRSYWKLLYGSFTVSALFLFQIPFSFLWIAHLSILSFVFFAPPLCALGTALIQHKYGFGGRFSLAAMFTYISVNSTPAVGDVNEKKFSGFLGIIRVLLASGRFSTPHSLGYSDPKAISSMCNWIKAVLR